MMLDRYRKLIDETENYLARIGIDEEAQGETLRKLIENLDCATLGKIVRSDPLIGTACAQTGDLEGRKFSG